ncbi:MAG: TetR/AcrR family transcriptional regulator [Candidatus Thorarchaeota archaeon]
MNDINEKSPREKRKKRRARDHRKEIIDVATKAFIAKGFEQTLVDQIAWTAEYSKATIYKYFPSKDDLFLAVIASVFDTLYDILFEYMQQPKVRFELRTLGDGYFHFVDQHTESAALFSSVQLGRAIESIIQKETAGLTLTESEKEFRGLQLKLRDLMTKAILNTLDRSDIGTKVEPTTIVMILSSLNSAIIDLILLGKKNNRPKEYVDVLFNILDNGLKNYDKDQSKTKMFETP